MIGWLDGWMVGLLDGGRVGLLDGWMVRWLDGVFSKVSILIIYNQKKVDN